MTAFVLDHVFVFCRPGAPEAARLETAGLRIGVRREHPGQGTSNVCFCFRNAYLELIWLADEALAAAPAVLPLALRERSRWRGLPTSPFGICVRPAGVAGATPPFPCTDYAPCYLPAGSPPIRVATNARGAQEPLLFALARDYVPPEVPHALAQSQVTRAAFTVPGLAAGSPLAQLPVAALEFAAGPVHRLELQLDGGRRGSSLDLQPELPVRLRW